MLFYIFKRSKHFFKPCCISWTWRKNSYIRQPLQKSSAYSCRLGSTVPHYGIARVLTSHCGHRSTPLPQNASVVSSGEAGLALSLKILISISRHKLIVHLRCQSWLEPMWCSCCFKGLAFSRYDRQEWHGKPLAISTEFDVFAVLAGSALWPPSKAGKRIDWNLGNTRHQLKFFKFISLLLLERHCIW